MKTFSDPLLLQKEILSLKEEGKRVGFVPTMGALHAGHVSLVDRSIQENDSTVVSIFVNPTQFGPHEDLEKYPRTLEADKQILSTKKVDILFLPTRQDIYPTGLKVTTQVWVSKWSNQWCGKSRKNHFLGVSMVVLRLLNIVTPTAIYMGEKDFQQVSIVNKMIQDLFLPIRCVFCPTTRESDGLAMSSRNRYLSIRDRANAISLYRGLSEANKLFLSGERASKALISRAASLFTEVQVEYLAVIDSQTLQTKQKAAKGDRIIVAGKVGSTRLIDNIALGLLV